MKSLISNNAPITLTTTNNSSVVIFGWELISPAQLNVINTIINHSDVSDTDSGVRMIALKTETIDDIGLGVSHPESGSMVIDLTAHFEKAMQIAKINTAIELNIFSLYHIELMKTILHEIHHITADHIGYESKEEEEELAEKWATTTLRDLAINSDIESGNYMESSTFTAMLSDEFRVNTELTNAFKEYQLYMMNNSISLHMGESRENESYTINSVKKLYAHFLGENPMEGDWIATNTVTATTYSVPVQTAAPIQQTMYHVEMNNEIPWETETQEELVMFAGAETSSASAIPTTPIQSTVIQAEDQAPVAVYPATHLDAEQTKAVVFGVYNKIFNKIFVDCKYTGSANPAAAFTNPEAVCFPIQLTNLEKQVIVKMDCLDQNGRWCPNMSTVNGLQGSILKNTKMPTFTIYINNNGMEQIRKLIPQNPGKMVNGKYSKLALEAQAGSHILHVFNGDQSAAQNYMCKCVNGTWQA